MEDPIRRHPTRAEQLDIIVATIADNARPGDGVLDLGCGTGYLGYLLSRARGDLAYVGVDRKGESLTAARTNLGNGAGLVEGDLAAVDAIPGIAGPWRFVVTALTFHDLDDAGKARVIGWVARHLAPDGVFLLYDRLRLTAPGLFPLQRSIWRRLERIHREGMRTADDFTAYERDLGTDNRPATLDDYVRWFAEAGLAFQVLHVHGNIALLAGAPKG